MRCSELVSSLAFRVVAFGCNKTRTRHVALQSCRLVFPTTRARDLWWTSLTRPNLSTLAVRSTMPIEQRGETMERESEEETLRGSQLPHDAQPAVVATSDGVDKCGIDSVVWLETSERGAYTTARTVGGNNVFELSFHLDRLVHSLELMGEDVGDVIGLKKRIVSSMIDAIHGYRSMYQQGGTNAELKITVLVTAAHGSMPPQVRTHVTELGGRAIYPVKVMIRGAPRENAEAKDSEWVRERKCLMEQKPADVNEVVLVGQGGSLYEGLSSNFYALKDGTLYTAGEGILMGSVREAVLRVAEQLGVPVVLEPPRLEELDAWDGAFVSSTSRLLLPIDEISVPDRNPPKQRVFVKTKLAEQLESGVQANVLASSESLTTSDA